MLEILSHFNRLHTCCATELTEQIDFFSLENGLWCYTDF